MSQAQLLVYFDHNVLDRMTKGDPDGVAGFLKRASLTPVYSSENLSEIRRSVGHENKFLEILERTGALHLVPVLDKNFRDTGSAEIRSVNPFDAFASYVENVNSMPEHSFGLTGMLQKFYDGRKTQSFEEIFLAGANELCVLLESAMEELGDNPGFTEEIRAAVTAFPEVLGEQYKEIGQQLDAEPEISVKNFDQVTGLGPKVLKNIKPPGVLLKIWDLVQERLAVEEIEFDTFFGLKPFPFEADAGRERTPLEKVNGIYHQLNYIGYYRDSKMSRERRFRASFSDMTHAGLATFCHLMISRDTDLVMKAAAAYEYLGLGTRILHYEAND